MSEIARELGHRVKPAYLAEQTKEAAVRKSVEMKDRVIDSPLAIGILGGASAALLGRWLKKRRQERELTGFAFEEEGRASEVLGKVKEQASALKSSLGEKAGELKERAGELKHRAEETVESVRERLPSGEELKQRAHDANLRARDYVGDEPLVTALAAISIGAALGFLLPLTQRERETMRPYREQVSEKLQSMSEKASDKVKQKVDELEEKIAGSEPPPQMH